MTINEKINDDVLSWIMKEKEGLTSDEEMELNVFLDNSVNTIAYKKYKNLFNDFTNLEESDKNSIKENITKERESSRFNKLFAPIAASILLVSFLSYFYYENKKVTYEKVYHTYNTKKVNIHLPDDSLIDLDVKSTINITYYKHQRLVKFPFGKALFSISKNKNRPFIIKSGHTQIEVIGTQFEVIRLENSNTINVIEGIVRVSYLFNGKIKNSMILKKGQSFTLNDEGKRLDIAKIDITNIAKWKNDLIKFENTTLKEALQQFARYSEKKITIKDYKVANFKISGVFSIKELDKFIEALPEIYPLKIIRNNDEIELISTID